MGAILTKHTRRRPDLSGAKKVDCDQTLTSAAAPTASVPPNPRASAASASLRDDEEINPSRSAAQSCFSDGLHSIFSFLPLRDFVVASRICLSWSAAASSQPPLRLDRWCGADQLRGIVDSGKARHFDRVGIVKGCFPHDLSTVLSLCSRLPHLRSMTIMVNDDPNYVDQPGSVWWMTDDGDDDKPLRLPSTLRELEVRFYCRRLERMEWGPVDSLLSRVCHKELPPITTLRIGIFPGGHETELTTQIPVETLSRILALKESLTELSIAYQNPHFPGESWIPGLHDSARWTQEHIDVFRQLTRLEKLDPFNSRWSDDELIMLSAEPTPAHLHLLPLYVPPETAAGGDALARLRLTELDFSQFGHSDFDDPSFLRRMPSLTSLHLGHVRADLDLLAETLAECTQLTHLSRSTNLHRMTTPHLRRFLPTMTRLRELHVHITSGGSLPFDAAPHLTHTLEKLRLSIHLGAQPVATPLSELQQLHALRNLRTLSVSFPVPHGQSGGSQMERAELRRTVDEFRSSDPRTFRRDLWPHMENSSIDIVYH